MKGEGRVGIMIYWKMFIAFFRIGLLGYGGGPGSIPLIHKEVVDKYKGMDDEDFGELLALANTLPGPIATKLAGYIGMTIAVLATILPTIVLMIVLLTSLSQVKGYDWARHDGSSNSCCWGNACYSDMAIFSSQAFSDMVVALPLSL